MSSLRRFVPWIFIPLLWVLCFGWSVMSSLPLLAPAAFIPLGMILGRRHGWQGAIAIAVGGMLLPLNIRLAGDPLFSPGNLGLYLVALAASMMAAGLFPWRRALDFLRTRPVAWLIIVLLPFHFHWGGKVFGEGLALEIEGDLRWVFWGALLLAGMSGVEWSILLLPAIGALVGFADHLGAMGVGETTIFGANAVNLPGFGLVEFTHFGAFYLVDQATSVIVLFAYFAAGRWLGWAQGGGKPLPASWQARWAVTALMLAGQITVVFQLLNRVDGPPEKEFFWNNEMAATVLAALLGGLWLGRGGILWTAVGALLLTAIQGLADNQAVKLGAFAEPVTIALVFGACGLLLRRWLGLRLPPARLTEPFPWQSLLALAGAVGALLPERYWTEDEEGPLVTAFVIVATVFVAGGLFRWWWNRRRLRNPALESDAVGWIALAALLTAAAAMRTHLDELKAQWPALVDLRNQLPHLPPRPWSEDYGRTLETEALIGLGALAGLWAILAAIWAAGKNLRECARDAQRAAARLAKFFGNARLAARLALPEPASAPVPAAPPPRRPVTRFLGYLQRGVAAMAGMAVAGLAFLYFEADSGGSFMADPRETPVSREEPRETAPPPPRLVASPALWQAARDFVTTRTFGIAQENPGSFPAILVTRWGTDPDRPNQRARYVIEVGANATQDLMVRVEEEERHCLLWFAQIARHAKRDTAAAQEARDTILGLPAGTTEATQLSRLVVTGARGRRR